MFVLLCCCGTVGGALNKCHKPKRWWERNEKKKTIDAGPWRLLHSAAASAFSRYVLYLASCCCHLI